MHRYCCRLVVLVVEGLVEGLIGRSQREDMGAERDGAMRCQTEYDAHVAERAAQGIVAAPNHGSLRKGY